ncbi:unnamed protein product [Adineta ricciae]|uniref:Uncharacterized protein n=1 Tax=Adineta ricciae TaxID=249248 RepID=A0A815FLJ9_ADIRI|nr:unnamed protein product [Adineta ricciae]
MFIVMDIRKQSTTCTADLPSSNQCSQTYCKNMQDFYRYLLLLIPVVFLVLSIDVVQCRIASTKSLDRQRASFTNIDYINICMFRKSRLCDFLREMHARSNDSKEEQDLIKRGLKRFYSNW